MLTANTNKVLESTPLHTSMRMTHQINNGLFTSKNKKSTTSRMLIMKKETHIPRRVLNTLPHSLPTRRTETPRSSATAILPTKDMAVKAPNLEARTVRLKKAIGFVTQNVSNAIFKFLCHVWFAAKKVEFLLFSDLWNKSSQLINFWIIRNRIGWLCFKI